MAGYRVREGGRFNVLVVEKGTKDWPSVLGDGKYGTMSLGFKVSPVSLEKAQEIAEGFRQEFAKVPGIKVIVEPIPTKRAK